MTLLDNYKVPSITRINYDSQDDRKCDLGRSNALAVAEAQAAK